MAKRTLCDICHQIIYASPSKGRSAGRVKIGGAWVRVHHDCYYKKEKADG